MSATEWQKALRLLRAVAAGSGSPAEARSFLAQCADPHLAKLAPLLAPPLTGQKILCALVPVERRASRERISDADMGISTADPAPANAAPMPLCVVADNIRSALNIGGIFRTCAFFGVPRLCLCGYTATPENPKVAKSAMGAENIVAWRSADSATDAIAALRAEGFAVYALETARDAADVSDWEPRRPTAIVVGNERFGLDPETVAACDGAVAIRGAGEKNSLNVVCALSIALFASTRGVKPF